MSASRYKKEIVIAQGSQLGTPAAVRAIRSAIKTGRIPIIKTIVLTGDSRLDTLAGDIYGEASYWWVLAASSDIGWGLQIPPGTVISIPRIEDVLSAIG